LADHQSFSGSEESRGSYVDGHPLDEVHYIEAKIILNGLRFTSIQSFHDFGKLVRKVARQLHVDFETEPCEGLRPQIREVLFLDTKDFKLYNNAFILRRRIAYEDGFPAGEPEIVFKFRHPDLEIASQLDVRPNIPGAWRIKFKEEWLPEKTRIGGSRSLYSHNVEFKVNPLSFNENLTDTATLVEALPALRPLLVEKKSGQLQLVNRTAVEEVLQQLGTLDFGKGLEAASNVSVWRARGDHRQLVGEFSFQHKFQRREELSARALQKCAEFFRLLQHEAQDWISLGTTKTGAVYRLKGNPPQSHE
jgi:hypothetical protein